MKKILTQKEKTTIIDYLEQYCFIKKIDAQYIVTNENKKEMISIDDKIISYLFMNESVYKINELSLYGSQLNNIAVHIDYRNRKYFDVLMQNYLNYTKARELINIVSTYQPKLFSKYNYRKIYDIHRYTISRFDLLNIPMHNISEEYSASDLCFAYKNFIKLFENALLRNLDYFEKLIEKVEKTNRKICVYRNENGACIGYAIYNLNKQGICKIDEIIYTNGKSFKRMLAFISEYQYDIIVDVSEYEKIQKIFKNSQYTKEKVVMLKINNIGLFNNLFSTKVKTSFELTDFFTKHNYFQDFLNNI